MLKKVIFILVSMSILTGCATIMSGGNQKIKIQSTPSSAEIKIFDDSNMEVWSASTPATVTLKKGSGYFSGASYRIEIFKEGYKKQIIQLNSSLNAGWYLAGNLLLGGLIGWLIVDPLSGGMWTLTPEKVNAKLVEEVSFLNNKDGLMIVLKEEITEKVFKKLEPCLQKIDS